MDKKKRISIEDKDGYSTIIVNNIENLYEKMKKNPRVGNKYKQMALWKFIEWIEHGITPKQFYKLQLLNDDPI